MSIASLSRDLDFIFIDHLVHLLRLKIYQVVYNHVPEAVFDCRVCLVYDESFQYVQMAVSHSRMHRSIPREPVGHIEIDGFISSAAEEFREGLDRACGRYQQMQE